MIETNTKQAEADLGHQLQTAKTNQKIKAETMQSKVISKKAEVSVQDQEILRQERILDSAVRKPATAAAYKIRIDAEAEAQKMIYEAQADSSAIVSRGLANADRIEKLGSAEGQAMKKKAEEMTKFTAEAIIEMVATTVPKIAAEISGPMSKANKVTMISGPGGDVGIERLTGKSLHLFGRTYACVCVRACVCVWMRMCVCFVMRSGHNPRTRVVARWQDVSLSKLFRAHK